MVQRYKVLVAKAMIVFIFLTMGSLMVGGGSVAVNANEAREPSLIAKDYIDKIESMENGERVYYFMYYNLAEGEIKKIVDEDLRDRLQSELGNYSSKVYTREVIEVLNTLRILNSKKDLSTYENLKSNLIPKITNALDREYLMNELVNWNRSFVYIPEAENALDKINKASEDEKYIGEAEKSIVDDLCYVNSWSMIYLQNQLNIIKSRLNNSKEKVFVLGDSISIGMACEYEEDRPLAKIHHAWWNNLDKEKYQISFLAAGGMGVLQQGSIKGIPMDRAIDLMRGLKGHDEINNNYDKFIIALGTNDFYYSPEEYKEALKELINYINSNYNIKEVILLNFYFFENEMKEVAEETKCKYIDIEMASIDKFDINIDNFHPSQEGHKQIAKVVASELEHPRGSP